MRNLKILVRLIDGDTKTFTGALNVDIEPDRILDVKDEHDRLRFAAAPGQWRWVSVFLLDDESLRQADSGAEGGKDEIIGVHAP